MITRILRHLQVSIELLRNVIQKLILKSPRYVTLWFKQNKHTWYIGQSFQKQYWVIRNRTSSTSDKMVTFKIEKF